MAAPTSCPAGSACTSRSGTALRSRSRRDIFGRDKAGGASLHLPVDKRDEFAPLDFEAKGADGQPRIPIASHVRLAHESQLGGIRILRRGYNFTDGSDGSGHLDAGLFSIAFVRDAHKQFVPMQQALAKSDVLNEYIEHNGSALFACPPGLGDTDDWAPQLFG